MAPHPIPDAALESDIAILGKKGRGKSYTARGLVERLLDKGRRVIVLDPLSTWWGLKAGPNAYPVAVLGGPHGDLPLADQDGEQLGRYLATANQSAVIDLGSFRKAELVRFATPFLEELYRASREPLWLVLEEADVFAPQQPMPETARLLGEVDRIARRGRQFGFKLISLTQRPARLNKDVLTQLSTLIALGLTSPQDRDAIKAWVEGAGDRDKAKEVLATLATLKVGEGWVWAPDHGILERVSFPKIKTLDTSATPKAGETPKAAKIRKDVDVDALRRALAHGKGAAVPRRDDASLVPAARASKADLAAAERRGYERGYAEGLPPAPETEHPVSAEAARRSPQMTYVTCGAGRDRPIIFSTDMIRALLAGRKTQTRRIIKPQPLVDCRPSHFVPVGIRYRDGQCAWEAHDQKGPMGSVFPGPPGCVEVHAYTVAPSDHLWLREACRAEELSRPQTTRPATRIEQERLGRTTVIDCDEMDGADGVRYIADDAWLKIENTEQAGNAWSDLFHYRGRGTGRCGHTVPPIHMPRWASRLTLTVTDVRVQRLQEISEEDAIAEGVSWPEGKQEENLRKWGYPQTARMGFADLWDSIHGLHAWDSNPWVAAITFSVEQRNIDAALATSTVSIDEALSTSGK